MTDTPLPPSEAVFPLLPCSTIVLRALLRAGHFDKHNNRVTAAAFVRRSKEKGLDSKGLSVDLAEKWTLDEYRGSFNKCYGIATLHVGYIRDEYMDVIQDAPRHGNITGVPYSEDDEVKAERRAGILANMARPAWSPPAA